MEALARDVNVHLLASKISVEIRTLLQYKSFYYELQVSYVSSRWCCRTGAMNLTFFVEISNFRGGDCGKL